MPPPSNQRADIEPPEEITWVAAQGFMTGVFRFGSVSILAHMIFNLPHPFIFSTPAPSPPTTQGQPRPRQSPFSKEYIRSRLLHRPLEGFSEWISPTARVYRGLTPQFKIFLQMAAMILGGSIWAERRVSEYIDLIRQIKRVERQEAERASGTRR
ncbi:hypothetical protein N7454_006341 [Penicillium verhagenii]|uniref:uncharacterized protein n=1 Tax=Penicillium verhagenii TaxID=1562060 RepID=UPI0025452D14|nr:uncharacterized protein N7466_009825 [Penicillium verhagenii]KAJ5921499.1 hypothetical protein N7466_009825 [Penicillium verhagenii]KAJ5934012.1 hypothetical protein N7454_006341 [Penicillium verhagenii]